jgi:hypothetical protein
MPWQHHAKASQHPKHGALLAADIAKMNLAKLSNP